MSIDKCYTFSGYDPLDGLADGEWVRDRLGIQRWVPYDPYDHDTYTTARDGNQTVACSTCGASPTQKCITRQGHRTKDHPEREIPRQCECGEALGWKRRRCDSCLAKPNWRLRQVRDVA